MRKWLLLFILCIVIGACPISVYGSKLDGVSGNNKVTLYFFHGDGCPHCEDEIKWLNEMSAKYSNLVIQEYEVWYNSENNDLMEKVKEKVGQTRGGVPFTIIGDKQFLGFSTSTGNSMESQIRVCSKHTYRDVVKEVLENSDEIQIGEELESSEETEEKEQIEEQKIWNANMKEKLWNPMFTVLGVGAMCGVALYTISISKKRG